MNSIQAALPRPLTSGLVIMSMVQPSHRTMTGRTSIITNKNCHQFTVGPLLGRTTTRVRALVALSQRDRRPPRATRRMMMSGPDHFRRLALPSHQARNAAAAAGRKRSRRRRTPGGTTSNANICYCKHLLCCQTSIYQPSQAAGNRVGPPPTLKNGRGTA
jgi:hypothetical protein